MFAYALGCSLLTMLLAAPAVADSSGHVFCRDSAADTAAVITTTDQRNDHGPLDVEFPRRVMTVWFYKPVKIGDRVLMGMTELLAFQFDGETAAHGVPTTR